MLIFLYLGHAWTADYGDPDKEDEFDYIYRYSPLHNVPDIHNKFDRERHSRLQYPSILLTTGDHDDRVSPLHSLKFYAELNHKLIRLVYHICVSTPHTTFRGFSYTLFLKFFTRKIWNF